MMIAKSIRHIRVSEIEGSRQTKRNPDRSKKENPESWRAEAVSRRPIWSFHPLNHSFHVAWLFAFQHSKLPAARGAGRHKIQFLMRRQHQMVAFAAPGHMIAESTSIRRFSVFPLDRDIFIESGHRCLRGCILFQPGVESKDRKPGFPLSAYVPAG